MIPSKFAARSSRISTSVSRLTKAIIAISGSAVWVSQEPSMLTWAYGQSPTRMPC